MEGSRASLQPVCQQQRRQRVSPTTGGQAQQVEFIPKFNGTQPVTWSWDFDVGALTFTSSSETPDETLLERGDHTVTVDASTTTASILISSP